LLEAFYIEPIYDRPTDLGLDHHRLAEWDERVDTGGNVGEAFLAASAHDA
jgi:hypothetical protein